MSSRATLSANKRAIARVGLNPAAQTAPSKQDNPILPIIREIGRRDNARFIANYLQLLPPELLNLVSEFYGPAELPQVNPEPHGIPSFLLSGGERIVDDDGAERGRGRDLERGSALPDFIPSCAEWCSDQCTPSINCGVRYSIFVGVALAVLGVALVATGFLLHGGNFGIKITGGTMLGTGLTLVVLGACVFYSAKD